MILSEGDSAPIFSLKNQDDQEVHLSSYIGKKALVIYFYPKNFTPGCVAEACSFRDHFEEFTDIGAMVIGISSDSVSSHARFAKKYELPFTMLSDKGNHVKKMYGIQANFMGLIPGRETFVIDKKGVIRMRFNSMMASKHISEALRMVKKICNE